MSAFLAPLAAFLAAVFALSAIGKLRAADRGRGAFAALRITVRHPDAAAIVLIVAEALIAIGLLLATGWLFVGIAGAALVLTAGLLVAVIRADRLGATDDCGCFGDWLPSPIGPRLIVRNLLVTVVAASVLAAALVDAGTSGRVGLSAALLGGSSAAVALRALGASALIASAVWAIARASDARPVEPLSAPAASSHGSGALLIPETGEIVDVLAPSTRARLLVFVTPGCHACATALASLEAAHGALGAVVDVYVVQGIARGLIGTEPAHGVPASARFALDIGSSVGAVLGIGPATPVGALIGTDGTRAGPLAMGSAEIGVLIESIRALRDAAPA